MVRKKVYSRGRAIGEITITGKDPAPAADPDRGKPVLWIELDDVFAPDWSRCEICRRMYFMPQPQIYLYISGADTPLEVCPKCLKQGHDALATHLPEALDALIAEAYWVLEKVYHLKDALHLSKPVQGATYADFLKVCVPDADAEPEPRTMARSPLAATLHTETGKAIGRIWDDPLPEEEARPPKKKAPASSLNADQATEDKGEPSDSTL